MCYLNILNSTMDKLKNLNLKKQLLSLKYCYEELVIENKALYSKVNYLETFFKQTKYYTRQKNLSNKNFDFNYKKDKKYQTISSNIKYLNNNIDKQSNTLKKSILFNKYNELIKEKEYLIQILEEKKSNLKSIEEELNLYKVNNPYNSYNKFVKLKAKTYLNEILETQPFNKKNKEKINDKDNSLINNKFRKSILKEKIRLKNLIETSRNELKNLYDYSTYCFRKKIKELGFSSIIKNKKNNKTYIITIEPNHYKNTNSSDSESEENTNSTNKSNSNNERLFFDDFQINLKQYKVINKKKNINSKNKHKNETLNNKEITFCNNNNFTNTEININILSNNSMKNTNNILTESNIERIDQLNHKLLTMKEIYYNCLDKRYQLKSSLKQNITQIYKTKEKIKKIKKQRNLK